jgi:putative ABC transport system ATP-binding protein
MNIKHQTTESKPDWVIETQKLTKVYQMGAIELKALAGVNVSVTRGEFVALMGTSGSGKSTLLHLLGCLDTPTSGAYYLEGRDVSALSNNERARIRNRRIGFVFQTFNLLARESALDNVMLPLLYRRSSKGVKEKAKEALERVGLGARTHHKPPELSGGELQRVAIARALVTDPAIILADEPTGNLDSKTGNELMKLLVELRKEGRTILMVTHDTEIASYAGRRLLMQDGLIVDGSADDVAA